MFYLLIRVLGLRLFEALSDNKEVGGLWLWKWISRFDAIVFRKQTKQGKTGWNYKHLETYETWMSARIILWALTLEHVTEWFTVACREWKHNHVREWPSIAFEGNKSRNSWTATENKQLAISEMVQTLWHFCKSSDIRKVERLHVRALSRLI